MTTDAAQNDPLPDFVDRALLDNNEHVDGDTPCVQCGYNLRTLAATGLCTGRERSNRTR